MTNFVQQVGGDHYGGSDYQWWDFADECGVPFLEATACKYILRWKEKDGIADLKKAISYIEKRLKSQRMHKGNGALRLRVDHHEFELDRVFMNMQTGQPERDIVKAILTWVDQCELLWAVDEMKRLISKDENSRKLDTVVSTI